MAKDLHNSANSAALTVQPATPALALAPHASLSQRLERSSAGRALLGCMSWLVVVALVFAGYVTAGAINSGAQIAMRGTAPTQPILAAANR